MKDALKKSNIEVNELEPAVSKTAKLPSGPNSIASAAEELLVFRKEYDRIGLKIASLKKFLREELPNMPGSLVEVGEEVVYLKEVSASESFDLESAEEILSANDAKLLKPYIKISRSFDLKAAKNLLDDKVLSRIKKFIKKSPNTTQVCVKDKKEKIEE